MFFHVRKDCSQAWQMWCDSSRITKSTSNFDAPLDSPSFCGNIALNYSQPSNKNNFEWRRLFHSSRSEGIKKNCSSVFSCRTVWEILSWSEAVTLLARQARNSTSGLGSFWERSPLGFWYSTSAIWHVPGTVPENFRTCDFKRNSSNLDKAPKMPDSVLLNSSNSFLVNSHTFFSENCAVFFSVIPGTNVFSSWLFVE